VKQTLEIRGWPWYLFKGGRSHTKEVVERNRERIRGEVRRQKPMSSKERDGITTHLTKGKCPRSFEEFEVLAGEEELRLL